MLIVHENMKIRNAGPGDTQLLCDWWNDGAVMAHAGFPNGLGTTVDEVNRQLEAGNDKNGRCHIIEIDGVPVGEMNYHNVGQGTAEIGIKMCVATAREKGYGTRFLRMFITELFGSLGFKKIVLDTNVNNTRAQHVYEKLGFRKLRVNQNAWRDQLGEWQSSIDYEMLPDDLV